MCTIASRTHHTSVGTCANAARYPHTIATTTVLQSTLPAKPPTVRSGATDSLCQLSATTGARHQQRDGRVDHDARSRNGQTRRQVVARDTITLQYDNGLVAQRQQTSIAQQAALSRAAASSQGTADQLNASSTVLDTPPHHAQRSTSAALDP